MTVAISFPASREAGMARLAAFLPFAGADYARRRNEAPGQGHFAATSGLSPYLRHRLVHEREVVAAVVACHGLRAAEMFVQEVCWRTYWKGWLQQRPEIWEAYLALNDAGVSLDLLPALNAARSGDTGIDAYDAWCRQLRHCGYLHNHERMWMASIWIFTLKLPWALGAAFMLEHLVDGDPASNTLSWRWVAGLQTPGKHYLARADNIRRFTLGRYNPQHQLDEAAAALPYVMPPAAAWPAEHTEAAVGGRRGWLLHADALRATPPPGAIAAAAIWSVPLGRIGPASDFQRGAEIDAARAGPAGDMPVLEQDAVVDWAVSAGLQSVVMPMPMVGPVMRASGPLRRALAQQGIALSTVMDPWDRCFWPHARRGYFALRKQIPALLVELGIGQGVDASGFRSGA